MSIVLHTGPMFSGKTTAMITEVQRNDRARKECIVLRPSIDTRSDVLISHSGLTPREIRVETIARLDEINISGIDVIGIDEAQFFDGLAEFCTRAAAEGRKIIVAGLDGDYAGTLFSEIGRLIPHCDKIKKHSAICSCGKKAAFTFRRNSSKEIVQIGGAEKYEPICRFCRSKIPPILSI